MSPLPPLPPRLQIEVTNRCALGCTSCARHHWDTAANPIGDLSEDTLDRLAPLLDSAIEVTVGGYGDPTDTTVQCDQPDGSVDNADD